MPTETLQTGRLVLRRHVRQDFEACLAVRSDPVVMRFLGDRPASAEEVWARLLRYEGHWAWLGFGCWAVCLAATGQYLGELGFAQIRRGIGAGFDGHPELGWVLAAAAQGQGFATEAAQAALAWSDSRWPAAPTVCMIAPDNAASLRVAAKCGYAETGRALYRSNDVVLFSR